MAAVAIGIVAVLLAYAFENQNVAFMAGLALSVAASCNFPVLTMATFWRGTTTRGAVAGGLMGLAASVVMVVLSKTLWVAVFHFPAAIFPYENPALFSMPLAFLFVWLLSVTDRSAPGLFANAPPSMRSSSSPRSAHRRRRKASPSQQPRPDRLRSCRERKSHDTRHSMVSGLDPGRIFGHGARPHHRSLTASTTEGVDITSTPLPVEHIVIKTMKPYLEVKAGIEKLGRFDDNMRAMLAKNDIEGLRAAAQRIQGVDGLAIHYIAPHGDLLALKGERRPLIAYYIGNVLSATEMTKINPAAGLYAPLRVVV
jgi:Sodium:solute symporter family